MKDYKIFDTVKAAVINILILTIDEKLCIMRMVPFVLLYPQDIISSFISLLSFYSPKPLHF